MCVLGPEKKLSGMSLTCSEPGRVRQGGIIREEEGQVGTGRIRAFEVNLGTGLCT